MPEADVGITGVIAVVDVCGAADSTSFGLFRGCKANRGFVSVLGGEAAGGVVGIALNDCGHVVNGCSSERDKSTRRLLLLLPLF